MILNNKRYSAIMMGIIIVTCVWITHFFATFSLLNSCAYDYLMRHYLTTSISEQLIVLDGDKQLAERGDEVWLPLLKNLLAQNAKQVVFNFLPTQVSSDFYQIAADSGKVFFGQQVLSRTPYSPPTLQPLPAAAMGKNIKLGLLSVAHSQCGIYRAQDSTARVNEQTLPTLEYLVAQHALTQAATTASAYFINFIGGTARLPKVKLTQALADGLVGELITGRTVMIGLYGMDALASYFTPLSTATEQTPDVLYHAFALDSLLAGRTIEWLPDGELLLIILAMTVISLITCQSMSFQRSLVLSVLLTLCYGGICWLMLHVFFLWVPPVELILTQWLGFMLVWRYRRVQEDHVLDTTLFNLSLNLQEKAFPVSFYHSLDPWAQLIVMINESLHLNRMIFLERISGDHRLKEIKAFKCSIEDVIELRRDYERTPYSTVIQENKPLLQEKPYLKPIATEEQHYLAPLIFAGEVLGFWAFTIELGSEPSSIRKFLALTQAYMTQISEILYYRQEWQKRLAQENNQLLAYLNFNTGTKPYQLLNQSVALLDRRIAELQQVFNSLNTGGVLYDLFGRVLLVNKSMEAIAQTLDLKLYTMTALDFITTVTGYDSADARAIMQKAIFDHEKITIPLLIAYPQGNRDYLLHIQPLKVQDNNNQRITDSTPLFQITGILCELEDVTELKSLYRLKEKMFERFSFQMRNDLATIVFALSLLEDDSASMEEKALALSSIQGKIEETLITLQSVDEQMSAEIEGLASRLGRYPINSQDSLNKVIATLSDYAALRAINVQLNIPPLLSLVFASSAELYALFHTILTILIDDGFEGGKVWIDVEEQSGWVRYHFHNTGIGIANNTQRLPDENTLSLSTEALKKEEIIHFVEHWGGLIDFSSQMGKGSAITLLLKPFL
jgi:CHASE2 domain-containing sensor protein/signal transduction histidine kinase